MKHLQVGTELEFPRKQTHSTVKDNLVKIYPAAGKINKIISYSINLVIKKRREICNNGFKNKEICYNINTCLYS